MQFTASGAGVTEGGSPRIARSARLRALAIDVGLGIGFQVAFAALAMLVFLVSTSGGDRDLSPGAVAIGWAITLAAVPAWLGYLGHAAIVDGRTPGEAASGLTVEGGRARRAARLAMHPLSSLGWGWLALVTAWGTVPGIPLIFAAVAVSVLGGGVISTALVMLHPDSLALHDRLAGTRLVAR